MKNALIVAEHPLFRLAIADLLRKQNVQQISEQRSLDSSSPVISMAYDLLIISVEPGDNRLIERLLREPRQSGGQIVVFSQVFGKRHRRLLARNNVDLCLPLSVHCAVAEKYLAEIIAPSGCITSISSLQDSQLIGCFLPDLYDLTNSERAVLFHLQQGLSNRAIAERMSLCLNTVKVHLSSACKKAGFSNRTQAALTTNDLISLGAL